MTDRFTIRYAQLEKEDEDEEDEEEGEEVTFLSPNYNIIGVSTEDHNSISIPRLYFVPRTKKLPKMIKSKYIRCTFEEKDDKLGVRIIQWLEKNAEHQMDMTHFIVAVNRPVTLTASNMIPTGETNY